LLFGEIEVEAEDPLWREAKDMQEPQERLRRLFRTAHQIAPLTHLAVQRAFQNHVDNAVSKTINLPEDATPDDILTIYAEAHRMGLKGTTVFRNKSRDYQILSCGRRQIC
jgi:ribonucleoside-diphosphate reductase alpha chain